MNFPLNANVVFQYPQYFSISPITSILIELYNLSLFLSNLQYNNWFPKYQLLAVQL